MMTQNTGTENGPGIQYLDPGPHPASGYLGDSSLSPDFRTEVLSSAKQQWF